MAGWRDNLLPASFRGVPFFVEGHEKDGGRNTQTHQFPGRDEPYVEDFGRTARVWRIRAYVIGDDYFAKRNALEAALEEEGPGELVHPYLGRIPSAAAPRHSLAEESRRGRYARFTITFAESGANSYPSSQGVRARALASAGARNDAAAETAFGAGFQVEAKPAFVFDGARDFVGGFLQDLRSEILNSAAAADPVFSALRDIDATIGDLGDLIRTPFDLAARARSAIGGFAQLLPAGRAALAPLLRLSDWGDADTTLSTATPSRVRIADNRTEAIRLFRRLSLSQAASHLAAAPAPGALPFASLDGALAARDEVLVAIDAEISVAGDRGEHETFTALTDLRVETIRFVNEDAASLPRLRSWTPPVTMPVTAIAYRLYDDAGRADETANRNRVRHPGFVAGGETLQVLDA